VNAGATDAGAGSASALAGAALAGAADTGVGAAGVGVGVVPTDAWRLRSDLYAFFGNSLLKVMTEQSAVGLDPAVWEGFPLQGANACLQGGLSLGVANEHLQKGLDALLSCTRKLDALGRTAAVERVGVEYTKLFVGPGRPAAPPWESLYREGGTALFGQPTFDMRRLLAQRGLKAGEGFHQLEDHLGFELLYLGACGAAFVEMPPDAAPATPPPSAEAIKEQQDFIRTHPLSFIGQMLQAADKAVAESSFVGYYPALIELIWGYLLWDLEFLANPSERR
jgi:TorA maturation chaperone TorD